MRLTRRGTKNFVTCVFLGSALLSTHCGSKGSTGGSTGSNGGAPGAATPIVTVNGQNLTLTVTVTDADGGQTTTTANTGTTGQGAFTGASCTGTGSDAFCAAVGYLGISIPNLSQLLVISTDGGATWSIVNTSGVMSAGEFRGVSCTGAGATAICVAVGMTNGPQYTPLIYVTTNRGVSWTIPTINLATPIDIPPVYTYGGVGILYGVSCLGSVPNVICVVAGYDAGGQNSQLIVASNDGSAAVWTVPAGTINNPVNEKIYYAIDCMEKSGGGTICVAVGGVGSVAQTNTTSPCIDISNDNGITWTAATIPNDYPSIAWFTEISYAGNGSSAVWTATGIEQIGGTGTIQAVSSNAGVTWSN